MSEVKEEEGLGNDLLEAQNEQVDRGADGEGSDLRTVKNGENGLIKEEYELEINNASVPLDIPADHGGVFVQIETPDDPNSSKDCGNGIPVAVRNQSFGKENGEEGYDMGHESNGFPAVKPEIVDGLAELRHEIGEGLIDDIQTAGNVGETVELKENGFSEMSLKKETGEGYPFNTDLSNHRQFLEGDESGTEEEQAAFTRELERFFKERSMEFKPPKFYGEGLNCLKLWRAVTRLGGYDQVTSCKLWRQVGESFKPPKTCTTISWSFRIFYEKALLDYERHKMHDGELPVSVSSLPGPSMPVAAENPLGANQASGSGRARRDAAARAMQGWHSQRLLGNGEVGDPIIKDKSSVSLPKREKQLKSLGLLKRKKPSNLERAVKAARTKATKPHMETMVVDVGPSADWVKINVRRTKDCFEIYALVPGLLREEVRVQSDPAGRLVISGEPEQPDNPWGVTPFKKVVSLPSRIDPHQTSAVVTLHGQLFVRAPFEQLDL